jgi:hypothetical protein
MERVASRTRRRSITSVGATRKPLAGMRLPSIGQMALMSRRRKRSISSR